MAESLLGSADGAMGADDYDGAEKLMLRAEAVALRAQNMPLLTRVRARKKETHDLAQQVRGLEAARKTLIEKPDDPEANLAVGQFTCFVKGDWEKGLPLLVKAQTTR